MKAFCWSVLAASVAALSADGQTAAQASDSATVKVIVCDTFGEPVPGAKITLTSVVPSGKFTATGGEAELDRVPFGLYNLEVRLVGFLTRKERLNINQPRLVFRTGLELGATHTYKRPKLSGSIKPDMKDRSDLWVRLVAMYSSDLVENAVDSAGKFELDGMAHGKYLLFLFQKDKLLAMKPIEVMGGNQVIEITVDSLANRK